MVTFNFQKIRNALFWGLSILVALVAWRFIPLGVEASMDFMAHHIEPRALALYAHIGVAPLVLFLLPFQFSVGLRIRRPKLHRWFGRIYAVGVLVSGVASLPLAAHTSGGAVAGLGFAVLAVLWMGVTAQAVRLAMQRRLAAHRIWMIRSAALTFAGVTLRLELPLLAMPLGIDLGYQVVAWACWIPNAILAEWMIRRNVAPAKTVAKPVAKTVEGAG